MTRPRVHFDGDTWRFEGDEGIEALRAAIPDDMPHMVAIELHGAPEALDLGALLHEDFVTVYYWGDDEAGTGVRHHATLKLRNDTLTVTLLDGTWLAMPACQVFEDLGASLPDHAARALASVTDVETELQMLDDNLLYPPFRQDHADELEQLFERRTRLPDVIGERLSHWERVESNQVDPRSWPLRRRGDPGVEEVIFTQLGESRVVARWEHRWRERGFGYSPVWDTDFQLLLEGRDLTVSGSCEHVSFKRPQGAAEHLGGPRYRLRVDAGDILFDAEQMRVECVLRATHP